MFMSVCCVSGRLGVSANRFICINHEHVSSSSSSNRKRISILKIDFQEKKSGIFFCWNFFFFFLVFESRTKKTESGIKEWGEMVPVFFLTFSLITQTNAKQEDIFLCQKKIKNFTSKEIYFEFQWKIFFSTNSRFYLQFWLLNNENMKLFGLVRLKFHFFSDNNNNNKTNCRLCMTRKNNFFLFQNFR